MEYIGIRQDLTRITQSWKLAVTLCNYEIYNHASPFHYDTKSTAGFRYHQMSPDQYQSDPTKRFTNRVGDYIRYRPGYPEEIIPILEKEAGLTTSSVIADIGSGTGISAGLFLRNGNTVYAVEPNDAMRGAAESLLREYPAFHSIPGTADATTLDNQSIDLVVAAQAFHWFDPTAARREFARILKPGGNIVLIWNRRKEDETLFLASYEALLRQFGIDYEQVRHNNVDKPVLDTFFDSYKKYAVYNEQLFNFEGLKGRLLSSSYVPAEGHPNHEPMLAQLRIMFDEYQKNGQVRFEYDTEIYIGSIGKSNFE